jgi:hypothetical protein
MPSTFIPFSIKCGRNGTPQQPVVYVGAKPNTTIFEANNLPNDSYWILILSANNPRTKVKEWFWPGKDASTVPPGLDAYMADPGNIFVVATRSLLIEHVPQGAFYTFLSKYGGGHDLQGLEQLNATLGYPYYSQTVTYILAGLGGSRTPVPPPSYETASHFFDHPALLLLSLQSMPNGGPPYGISDGYSWQ